MKNSNLENWLNELNEIAGIRNKNSVIRRHPFETLNAEIEKLVSISLKEQMKSWEKERQEKHKKDE